MVRTAAIAAVEAETPWTRESFRSGLASLTASTATASRRYAADACTLAYLAAQVPRRAGDETGGTAWTSFRREVAVARSVSDQAAAAEIRAALRLTSVLPQTLELLHGGRITVARARAFVEQLHPYDDHVARRLDADLAADVSRLAAWRMKQLVRRAVLALDPDAAAVRAAAQTAARGLRLEALDDGQGCVVITGPAAPLTRWHATLDARARALRAAGDPRNLDALRFDLAVSAFPCTTHNPADTSPRPTPAQRRATPARRATLPPPAAPPRPAALPRPAARLPPGCACPGSRPPRVDCRMSRPVQATIIVPVETSLGLSDEPAWLDGYGWIDAPTSRTLLLDAELRRACADRSTGQLIDLAAPDGDHHRPPPACARPCSTSSPTTSS